MKIKQIFWIFFIILACGCSRIQLAVDFAPRYLVNKLDDSFDFSSARYDKIKKSIAGDIKKSQKEIAETLIAKIDDVLVLAEKEDLALAEIQSRIENLRELQKRLVALFKESIAIVTAEMSGDEFQNMKKDAEEKFKEYDERLSRFEKFQKKAKSNFEDTMDSLFDSVSPEQSERFAKFTETNKDFYIYNLQQRREILNTFEQTRPQKDKFLELTLKFYAGDLTVRSEEYEKKQLQFRQNVNLLVFDIWKSTDEKQKRYFKKKLSEFREELALFLQKQ